MSYAILSSLGYVDNQKNIIKPLDYTNLNLSFSKPDLKRFPLLDLGFKCIDNNPSYAIAFQISNEISVKEYLDGKIKFGDIYKIVDKTLNLVNPININTYEDVYSISKEIKDIVKKVI